MEYRRSKSSIFLLEILINLLLFSMLCVCSLQFFIKAYTLTENTTALHQAVTACSSVASIYESGDGTMEDLLGAYPYGIHTGEQLIIYFNENYMECQKEEGAYYILVEKTKYNLSQVSIRFYQIDKEACYSIKACNYKPLTPASAKEVLIHE